MAPVWADAGAAAISATHAANKMTRNGARGRPTPDARARFLGMRANSPFLYEPADVNKWLLLCRFWQAESSQFITEPLVVPFPHAFRNRRGMATAGPVSDGGNVLSTRGDS